MPDPATPSKRNVLSRSTNAERHALTSGTTGTPLTHLLSHTAHHPGAASLRQTRGGSTSLMLGIYAAATNLRMLRNRTVRRTQARGRRDRAGEQGDGR